VELDVELTSGPDSRFSFQLSFNLFYQRLFSA
jgi:hypothetical protein